MKISVQIDPPTQLEIDRLKQEIKIRLSAMTDRSRSWLANKLLPQSSN